MLLEEVLRSLSRWLPWSIREGHEWIALRFILPVPSRRVAQRLGPLRAAGGGKTPGGEASTPGWREPLPSWPTAPAGLGPPGEVHHRPGPAGTGVSHMMARPWPHSESSAALPSHWHGTWGSFGSLGFPICPAGVVIPACPASAASPGAEERAQGRLWGEAFRVKGALFSSPSPPGLEGSRARRQRPGVVGPCQLIVSDPGPAPPAGGRGTSPDATPLWQDRSASQTGVAPQAPAPAVAAELPLAHRRQRARSGFAERGPGPARGGAEPRAAGDLPGPGEAAVGPGRGAAPPHLDLRSPQALSQTARAGGPRSSLPPRVRLSASPPSAPRGQAAGL